MKQPELKFGRPVIAWDDDDLKTGIYICHDGTDYSPHGVYDPDIRDVNYFNNAKPDLSAPPMNGDEVIGKYGAEEITGRYIGLDRNGYHVIDNERVRLICCGAVRHPQPSKRERVIDIITNIQIDSDPGDVADEILKITEDE